MSRRRRIRNDPRQQSCSLPLNFRLKQPRTIAVDIGLVVQVGYVGTPTYTQIRYLDDVIVPLFVSSSAMLTLLDQIASGTFPGLPSFLDDPPPWLIKLQEAARHVVARRR